MTARIRSRLAAGVRALRGAPARLAAVAGLVTFAVLAGTTGSYAYFQITQQASATATSGTLAITTANFTSLAYTFRNDQIATAGSFTVTNTSDTADGVGRAATITLSTPTSDSAQARNTVSYVFWVKGTNETCATGHSKTGAKTWANASTISVTLAPQASVSYCVESYVTAASSLAVAGGSLILTPTIAATTTAGGWTAATSATTGENSVGIYPATSVPEISWWYIHPATMTNYCLDDANFSTTSGSALVINYGCKTTTLGNQQWQFKDAPVAGAYEMVNRAAPALTADSQGTASGNDIRLVTDSAAGSQNWIPQLVSGTAAQAAAGSATYQYVNRSSNLCLTVGAQGTDGLMRMVQAPCTGAANQQFTLELAQLESFTCSTTNTGNTSQRVQYSWANSYNSGNNGPYRFTTVYGGQTRQIAVSADATATSVQVNGTAPAGARLIDQANGTYTVTVLDDDGSTVATTQVVVKSQGAAKYLACAP